MIRVLIVDDSLTVRKRVRETLERSPELSVVGEAADGREAVAETRRLLPDVVVMDIVMPVMDGIEAVKRIMRSTPRPIVILSSSLNRGELYRIWDAMLEGAVARIEKTGAVREPARWEKELIRTVRAAARINPGRWEISGSTPVPAAAPETDYNVVAFGASTGGPGVLARILLGFPADFALPVLLVIHSSDSGERSFAHWLRGHCPLAVVPAGGGERITEMAGKVVVAPPGRHMVVRRGRIRLLDSPPVNFSRPSVDVLFDSLAQAVDMRPIGVLLTGIGEDGARGLKAIRETRGYTICQDESTSIVFGMPRVAIALGGADLVLPDFRIAEEIGSLTVSQGKRG